MKTKVDGFDRIRDELRLYQLQLVADEADVNIQTLHNWLNGTHKPRYTNLVKIAEVLGFTINIRARRIK